MGPELGTDVDSDAPPPGLPRSFSAVHLSSWPFVGEGRHYDVHPDGRQFLRIRREVTTGPGCAVNEVVVVVVENWFEELRERVGN